MSFQDVYGSLVSYGIAGIPKLLHKLSGVLGLSQGEILFLDLLHTFRFEDKYTVSTPSLSALADYTGLSKRSLINWSKSLQEKGLIKVKARYKGKRQTSNLYDFKPLYRVLFEFLVLIDTKVYPDLKTTEGRDFHRFVCRDPEYKDALKKVLLTRAEVLKGNGRETEGYIDLLRSAYNQFISMKEEEERVWA